MYQADTKPAYDIQLTPEQTFGDTDDIIFDRISRFAVHRSGHVYISSDAIIEFSPDGKYVGKIGRSGRGPGEFQNLAGLTIKGDTLVAHDVLAKRVSVYRLNPTTYSHSFNLGMIQDAGFHFGQGDSYLFDDYLLVEYSSYRCVNKSKAKYLYKVNLDNGSFSGNQALLKSKAKTVFSVETDTRFLQGVFPFDRTSWNGISSDGDIYSINTGNILVKTYNKQGGYIRAFFYPYKNKPIDIDTILDEGYKISRSDLPDYDFPETWPAVHSMVMDNRDRIWLSTIVENDKIYEWWVLNKDGKLLAQFKWPRNKEIKVVKNDKVYALEEDLETGVDSIVRYKMRFSPTKF